MRADAVVASLVLIAAIAAGAAAPAPPTPATPGSARATFANGLRAVAVRRPADGRVAIGLDIDVPVASDPTARAASAIVLSAVGDCGPTGNPITIWNTFNDLGGTYRHEHGRLQVEVPARNLRRALDQLARLVSITRVEPGTFALASQYTAQRANDPDLKPRDEAFARLFQLISGEPGVDPVTLADVTLRHVNELLPRLLRADALTLAIAGDVDPSLALHEAERAFSRLERVPPLPPRAGWTPLEPKRLVAVRRATARRAQVVLALRKGDPSWRTTVLSFALASLLDDGESSRLYRALRADTRLTYAPYASSMPLPDCSGQLVVGADFAIGDLDAGLAVTREEIARLATDALTADEWQRGLASLDSLRSARADSLIPAALAYVRCGPPDVPFEDAFRLAATGPDDASRLAASLASGAPIAGIVVTPGDAEAVLAPEGLTLAAAGAESMDPLLESLRRAQDLLDTEPQRAVTLLEECKAKRPASPEIGRRLATALLAAGFPAVAAVAEARRALELNPYLLATRGTLVDALYQAGDYEEALRMTRETSALVPDDGRSARNEALLLERLGRVDEATRVVERALEVEPGSAVLWRIRGALALDKPHRTESAIEYFERATRLDDESAFNHAVLGRVLLHLARPTDAVAPLREAVALDPHDADAWSSLGDALSQTGDSKLAAWAYEHVTELRPKDADAWSRLGEARLGASDQEDGLDALRQAAELDPENVERWKTLGKAAGSSKTAAELALAAQRKIFKLEHDGPTLVALVKGLVEAKRAREAEELLRKVTHNPKLAHTAWTQLGTLYNDTLKDYPAAIGAYASLVALDENDELALSNLANSLKNAKQYEAARDVFHLALARNPEDEFSWRRLGETLVALDDHAPASLAFERAARLAQREPNLLSNLGWARYNADFDAEAVPALCRAVELDPRNTLAWRRAGRVFTYLDRYDEALAALERAVELAPKDETSRCWLGDALVESKRTHDGVVEMRRAMTLDPNYGWCHRRLALALEKDEGPAAAIAEFERLIDRDARNASCRVDLGDVLSRADRPTEALAAYRRAVELDPGLAKGWQKLGDALDKAGDESGAVVAYSRGCSIGSGNATSCAYLGRALSDAGRYDEALPPLRRAVELDPKYAWAWRHLGDALIALERPVEGLAAYERNVAVAPTSAVAWSNYGDALARVGHRSEGILKLRRAVELDPTNAWAWERLGDILAKSPDDRAAALEALDIALTSDPRRTSAHRVIGSVLARAGRRPEARSHLERALELTPDSDFNWRAVARIYSRELLDFPAALAAAERGTVLAPGDAAALEAWAEALADAGREPEALEILGRVLVAEPGRQSTLMAIARIRNLAGDRDGVLAALRTVAEIGTPGALNDVAWFIAVTFDTPDHEVLEEGRRYAAEACAKAPSGGRYDTLAELQFRLGQIDEALASIDKALATDDGRDYFHRQRVRFQRGLPPHGPPPPPETEL